MYTVLHPDLHRAMASPLQELVIHMKVVSHSRQAHTGAGSAAAGAARMARSPTMDATCSRFSHVCRCSSCSTPRPLVPLAT